MSVEFNLERRRLFSLAAFTAAAVKLGFADAADAGSDTSATTSRTAIVAARPRPLNP
ncbi:hypothetical protein IB276_36085 [Ensifer sp. ENS04]|jgi:hypothetical protein|nr:hypothetical protein [Ensifer sp. ENS04]MBD9544851.1 hypothetical protein [Ensifer sp. ENS04]